MQLMTKELQRKFEIVGAQDGKGINATVLAHYFNPTGRGDWYATEYDPESGTFFGFVSIFGDHCNEWGYFTIADLQGLTLPLGLSIERDRHYTPRPISYHLKQLRGIQ